MSDYQVSSTNVELERIYPTLVNLTKLAGTGLILRDLAKITVGMVSPCIFVVVCVSSCLRGSLVAMCGHVTHVVAQLVMQTSCM